MTEGSERRGDLDAECGVFGRYLHGVPPPAYVRAKYAEACARRAGEPRDAYDRWLLELARRGPLRARTADVFARVFLPDALVRRRLILLLAILESTRAAEEGLDSIRPTSLAGFAAGAAWRVLVTLVLLAAGAVVLAPARLLIRGDARRAEADA